MKNNDHMMPILSLGNDSKSIKEVRDLLSELIKISHKQEAILEGIVRKLEEIKKDCDWVRVEPNKATEIQQGNLFEKGVPID